MGSEGTEASPEVWDPGKTTGLEMQPGRPTNPNPLPPCGDPPTSEAAAVGEGGHPPRGCGVGVVQLVGGAALTEPSSVLPLPPAEDEGDINYLARPPDALDR